MPEVAVEDANRPNPYVFAARRFDRVDLSAAVLSKSQLIERLWKQFRKQTLYNKCDERFDSVCLSVGLSLQYGHGFEIQSNRRTL